jgi:hypothetical protein
MRKNRWAVVPAVAALTLACSAEERADDTAASVPSAAAGKKAVQVTGGGPVIQVIPGPAQFADSARPVIEKMPAEAREMTRMMAAKGPFSDTVAVISGSFQGTYWDGGSSGDSVSAVAEFTSADGAQWRVVIDRVAAQDPSPMEPHFGGVALDMTYHGSTGIHTPLVPTVKSAVSLWGMASVYRNGQLVHDAAPVHTMLTSDARGEDFAYQCWDCTDKPIRQLHLMLPPPDGKPYEIPGGVIHVMWEESSAKTP